MSPLVYYILHVASLLALTAGVFYGFAGAPGTRKTVMIVTGIASILMLVSGFGLLAKIHANQFSTWVIVKLVVWLALSALAGIGYRKRDQAGLFMGIVGLLLFVGLLMVYYVRFQA